MITGVENFGLFVTGIELPAEGFVHISSLTDDYYRYDRAGHVIAGYRSRQSYRLGDTVRVAVAAVDVDAASWTSACWPARRAEGQGPHQAAGQTEPQDESHWPRKGIAHGKN